MKTEEEVREEIEATKRTMDNFRNAFKEGKISKEDLSKQMIDCYATLSTLSWVLGENDRYD